MGMGTGMGMVPTRADFQLTQETRVWRRPPEKNAVEVLAGVSRYLCMQYSQTVYGSHALTTFLCVALAGCAEETFSRSTVKAWRARKRRPQAAWRGGG